MTTLLTWAEAARRAGQHFGKEGGLKAAANMTPEARKARAIKARAAQKWRPVKK